MVAVAAEAEKVEVERLVHRVASENAVQPGQDGFDDRVAARRFIPDYLARYLERISDLSVVGLLAVAEAPWLAMLKDAAQCGLAGIVVEWSLGRAADLICEEFVLHPCLELGEGVAQ